MTFHVPSFARHLGTLAVLTQLLASGCSTKDTGGEVNPLDNSPCSNELKGICGGECDRDSDCGPTSFMYCENGACTSQCTKVGEQCIAALNGGGCDNHGRCKGTLVIPSPNQTPPAETGGIIVTPGTPTNGGGGINTGCATSSTETELSDVNMYIMFDQSLSMRDDNKWQNATDALVSFLEDPATNGLNIALRFFPSNLPVAGCVDEEAGAAESCQSRLCEQPLIDIGLVTDAPGDPQETLLVDAINAADPGSGVQSTDARRGGGTPISAALGGAIQWSVKYKAAHPDQKTVVVFVTDGEPHGCDESTAAITALAQEGAGLGIPTYSIGLPGSATALMQGIATAGGTGAPYIIMGSGQQAAAELLTALNSIRGSAAACDFEVPNNARVNPNQVNVTFTTSTGDKAFYKVDSASDCGTDGAWYYDDNASPTRMFLCKSTCDMVAADKDAKLNIVFGCATQTTPIQQN